MVNNFYRLIFSFFSLVFSLFIGWMSLAAAQAQVAWPSAKSITLIVPFSAGGSTDGVARLFAQKLGERVGQAVVGRGVDKVIMALVMVQWAHYARIMRSRALQERRKEYVEAAANLGLPVWRIMLVHLLPNCLGPVMVFATIQIATAITLEATLSFLGVGVPITEPSLGLLIANGFQYLLSGDYWISMFPGLALLTLILSINIVGDRLRDALDPRRS